MPRTPDTAFAMASGSDADGLVRRLAGADSRLTLVEDPPVKGRLSWIDTFDRRLITRGLSLRREELDRVGTFVLEPLDGSRPMVRTRATSSDTAALPPGVLDAKIGPLRGDRRLLAIGSAQLRRRAIRALDGERKTVARLVIDELRSGGRSQTWVRLDPVRGYQQATRRLSSALAGSPSLTRLPEPLSVSILGWLEVPTQDPNRLGVVIDRDLAAGEAWRAVLSRLADVVAVNVQGTVDDVDTEFLHDLRVAVRRTRSALKLADDALPAAYASRFAARFRWLGDRTTPTRDLDVHVQEFASLRAELPPEDRAALDPLEALLHEHRHRAQAALVRTLRSRRFDDLMTGWRDLLARPTTGATPVADEPAGTVVARRLRKIMKRVLQRGAAITDDSPDEALHDLRKRCKELRYGLELFGSMYAADEVSGFVRELKRLQDNLGAFQDGSVQRAALVGYGDELRLLDTPAGTLLAMGRVVSVLEHRQQAARHDFRATFDRFARASNRRRFIRMVDGAT